MRLAGSVALVWLVAGTVHADPPAPGDASAPGQASTPDKAAALFQAGRALLDAGDYAGACARFDQSYALDHDAAGTMLNLGLCNEKLGKYHTALDWYRKALDVATEKKLSPQSAQAARDRMTALTDLVATVTLQVSPVVPATKVTIDGETIRPDSYARIEIDPGHHVLEAIAPGKKLVHQTFDVTGHGNTKLELQLVDGDNSVVVDRGHARRAAGMAVMIGGAALLAADTAVVLVYNGRYHQYKDCFDGISKMQSSCPDPGTSMTRANAAIDKVSVWGNTLFFTGIAAAAAGAYLYFWAPKPERIDRVVFAPQVSPTQLGLSVSGRF